ncbi:MAG: hypothetical protein AAF496_03170 [Pseudomonadota bacterium]
MVQNNKVLTVSYGTFSCTLEGFDDSFETMKSIAEYFRDLAAEDRYFGSEPPQPDAEMLTRIARRDPSQQVEAHQSETGILLRASDAATAPAAQTIQTSSQTSGLNVVGTPADATDQEDAIDPFFVEAEPIAASATSEPDSLAAKLQRIRAVVSHSDVSENDYSEDDGSALLNTPPPVDAVAAAFEAGSLTPEDLAPTTDVETADQPVEESASPAPAVTEEYEEDESSSDILFADESDLSEPEKDDEEEDGMINIMQDTDTPDHADGDDIADMPVETDPGILTIEDEADLLAEISQTEDEIADPAAQDRDNATDLDQDVSRLMAKAGEHMQDPESSHTRDTYSHLRTAVAATEADSATKTESEDEPYRGDLASVVSPRRPEIQVTSMRPDSDRAAPLKLVAEQRVDDPNVQTGPVTPRRVTTEQDEDTSEEGGFAQFAQDQGAQSLPDLLEAAAAYLSFIEGQEQFSRPQLMNKVRSLKQDEFNREESLRSFGQLLRDGKIEKAGGGRFAASNLIGFRPNDARAVG